MIWRAVYVRFWRTRPWPSGSALLVVRVMQAGLTTRRLTFRDIFLATTIPLWSRIEVFLLTGARNPVSSEPVPVPSIYSSARTKLD